MRAKPRRPRHGGPGVCKGRNQRGPQGLAHARRRRQHPSPRKNRGLAGQEAEARVIDARARGLANIHAAVMTLFVGVVFWAWAYVNLNFHVPYVHMSPYENLLPYFLCAIGGMLLSARDESRHLAARFHLPDFGASARLAFRQVSLMALLIFTLM